MTENPPEGGDDRNSESAPFGSPAATGYSTPQPESSELGTPPPNDDQSESEHPSDAGGYATPPPSE